MTEIFWGLPVIGYLFLAGMGAGALTVSASVLLRGSASGFGGEHVNIARYGALIAPPLMIVGTGMIIFELGTFQAAIDNGEFGLLFRWIYLFLTINLSPMSIGSWVLGVAILASLAYAYTFIAKGAEADGRMAGSRRALAWIGVPLGIAVAIYTGVMLGAMPARPFWNTPLLALLFLLSSLSTGVAAILLLRAIFGGDAETGEPDVAASKSSYLLTSSDAVLIGFELLAVVMFLIFAQLTIGGAAHALAIILPGGSMAGLFWIGFVAVGLVLPVLVELRYVVPTLLRHKPYRIPRGVEILVCAIIIVGGFMLRYVVVIAGQITGPVGI